MFERLLPADASDVPRDLSADFNARAPGVSDAGWALPENLCVRVDQTGRIVFYQLDPCTTPPDFCEEVVTVYIVQDKKVTHHELCKSQSLQGSDQFWCQDNHFF